MQLEFIGIQSASHAHGASGRSSASCLRVRQLQRRQRRGWHAAARLLSMAASMWMTMGSASVGRGGACTDMTVNTLYLRVGVSAAATASKVAKTGTHGANKNSSSPATLLLHTRFTCLHLFIRLCSPAGSKWMTQ